MAPADSCGPEIRTGIMLVHGLSDSPFVFRDLARYLAERCIEVVLNHRSKHLVRKPEHQRWE